MANFKNRGSVKLIKENYKTYHELIKDIKMFNDIRYNIMSILSVEPMSDKRINVLKKLEPRKQLGVIFKHIVGIAYKERIPTVYINEFINSRSKYAAKTDKYRETRIFLIAVIQAHESNRTRKHVIENILE
jgi:hypothetical protein